VSCFYLTHSIVVHVEMGKGGGGEREWICRPMSDCFLRACCVERAEFCDEYIDTWQESLGKTSVVSSQPTTSGCKMPAPLKHEDSILPRYTSVGY